MTSTASTTSVASMTSTASFHQKTFNLNKSIYIWWFFTYYYFKKAPKSQNKWKIIKEQEVLSNWILEGVQHQKKIKTDEFSIKVPISLRRRTKNICKNPNQYSQQSQITYYSLRWDTLYIRPTYFHCLRRLSWSSTTLGTLMYVFAIQF